MGRFFWDALYRFVKLMETCSYEVIGDSAAAARRTELVPILDIVEFVQTLLRIPTKFMMHDECKRRRICVLCFDIISVL